MPPKPTSESSTPTGAKKHQNQNQKAVPTPKPPKAVAEQLKRHFNSLCAQIDGGYFKNAIKTCNKILRLDPHDKEALAAKLFLLIQTDQGESALKVVEEDKASEPAHQFEKAYILYWLRKESEALGVLNEMDGGESSRALMHLGAQIKYRQADYEGAREIYNSLLDSCPEDTEEHADLVTNLNATQAHLDFFQSGYAAALNTLEISVAALEDAGAPHIPGPSTSAISALPTAATVAAQQQQKAPRKARIPKHVIPGLTPMPDPERWLKKRERTSHRMEVGHGRGSRKGKKGKEGMGAGSTQGMLLPPEKDVSGPPARSSTPSGGASAAKRGKKGR
ncbi:hypothetical protein FRB94_011313 [Tulasnella sp. JGI-2019a]|nr:hypothetical protein FRB93_009631 [Tulasnella sp. JGI-2019a]KAG8992759.1 hypothetical protein FRB94_011313 [Tulasnella sp. JGI-2019a]KAG9030720.1 hypothetical protein FRB95_003622 [Tulasnella sp. JGI-2019a]